MKLLNDPDEVQRDAEVTFDIPPGGYLLCRAIKTHISKASLKLESNCRKAIFATLILTLPIQ